MHATANTSRPDCLIAVVDDDRPVRDGLCNLLMSAAYASVGFESAEALLGYDRLIEIACLILDVKLPGIDGFELQQRLLRSGQTMPVVFVSSYGDAEMHERALRAGAVAFLCKPIDVEALLEHLRHAVAHRGGVP
jgi:FixJ family two-component response regulator